MPSRSLVQVMVWALVTVTIALFVSSCARLPYTTKVVHDDPRVIVKLQQDVERDSYSHPIQLTSAELTSILERFSYRPKQRMPLRWYAEENPPKAVFRADELELLVGPLAEGLQAAGPGERVHFELRAPGFNPAARHDVVAGWMAIREPYLYFNMEHIHVQVPSHRSDLYDYNYPTPPPPPVGYLLYFEPGRFWVAGKEEEGLAALDYRQFLKAPTTGDQPVR